MSKNQDGRLAGHHITPGQGWRWQEFGGRMMLVTDGRGADLVLSARHKGGGLCELTTCGPDGTIVPLKPDTPMGVLLEALPDLVAAGRDFITYNDRPRQLPIMVTALERAGLL